MFRYDWAIDIIETDQMWQVYILLKTKIAVKMGRKDKKKRHFAEGKLFTEWNGIMKISSCQIKEKSDFSLKKNTGSKENERENRKTVLIATCKCVSQKSDYRMFAFATNEMFKALGKQMQQTNPCENGFFFLCILFCTFSLLHHFHACSWHGFRLYL